MAGDEMKIAKAGEQITPRAASKLRKTNPVLAHLVSTREGCTVAPKSDAKDGRWACADCGVVFDNNFGAHNHTRSHRRVWWTGSRFEQP